MRVDHRAEGLCGVGDVALGQQLLAHLLLQLAGILRLVQLRGPLVREDGVGQRERGDGDGVLDHAAVTAASTVSTVTAAAAVVVVEIGGGERRAASLVVQEQHADHGRADRVDEGAQRDAHRAGHVVGAGDELDELARGLGVGPDVVGDDHAPRAGTLAGEPGLIERHAEAAAAAGEDALGAAKGGRAGDAQVFVAAPRDRRGVLRGGGVGGVAAAGRGVAVQHGLLGVEEEDVGVRRAERAGKEGRDGVRAGGEVVRGAEAVLGKGGDAGGGAWGQRGRHCPEGGRRVCVAGAVLLVVLLPAVSAAAGRS